MRAHLLNYWHWHWYLFYYFLFFTNQILYKLLLYITSPFQYALRLVRGEMKSIFFFGEGRIIAQLKRAIQKILFTIQNTIIMDIMHYKSVFIGYLRDVSGSGRKIIYFQEISCKNRNQIMLLKKINWSRCYCSYLNLAHAKVKIVMSEFDIVKSSGLVW